MVLQQPQAPRGSPVPRAELANMVETTVVGLGYDLADCEIVSRGRLVRVFMDKAAGAVVPGITVDDCARVSNQLSRVLEVEGVDYDRLEVSSPGLDRALKTPAQFRRFVGHDVELRLRAPEAGRKRFSGVLCGVDESEVEVEVEGTRRRFAIAALEKARLVPRF